MKKKSKTLTIVSLVLATMFGPAGQERALPSESARLQSQPWRSDFDAIVEPQYVRALVPYSKTSIFWIARINAA